MNYRHVYMRIISHAKQEMELGLRPKNQNQKKNFPNQYFEFHHILPRSLYPNWIKRKSNIVSLTQREHFFCHQLLTKIYPSNSMNAALWLMYTTRKGIRKNSKEYAKYKNIWLSRFKDPFYRKLHGEKISKALKGVPKSEDHKKKDSEAHKGFKNGMFGKPWRETILKKYGKEKGLEVLENRKKLIGDKNRGAKNGMFNRSPGNAVKVICESTKEIWSSIPKFEKDTGISRGRLYRSLNNSKPIIYKGEKRFFRIQKPLKG